VAWTRTLHIYLTMFAFLMMMFFALTGILLNHEDLLPGETVTEQEGTLPLELLREPDRLMVVERLRADYGAVGAVSTFDTDDRGILVEMKGPGRTSEAEIDRATGKVKVTVMRRGALVMLDDLHRGKDSGTAWRWVIDISGVLLLVASLSGILMWVALPRRRKWGVVSLLAGTLIMIAIVAWMVP
jgi:hypothetical protein